jgi:hypothetical protein
LIVLTLNDFCWIWAKAASADIVSTLSRLAAIPLEEKKAGLVRARQKDKRKKPGS